MSGSQNGEHRSLEVDSAVEEQALINDCEEQVGYDDGIDEDLEENSSLYQLDDIHYSRDETISAVRQFYTFLSKMYIDESDILEPPEGGWPHVENLRCMGKTDEVYELLRHLPYLRNKHPEAEDGTTPCVAPCATSSVGGAGTKVTPGSVWFRPDMDWGHSLRQASEPYELVEEGSIPPSVVGLTYNRWRDDKYFLLDTVRGIVHWYEPMGEIILQPGCPPSLSDDLYEGAPEKEWEWRAEHWAWTVPDLFAILRRQFEELNFVPLGPRNVAEVFNANPGRCTDTGGYLSNAEIAEIIRKGDGAQTFHDGNSNTDVMLYKGDYVSYMTDTTKITRRSDWQGLNFAGTTDWALDLQNFGADDMNTPPICQRMPAGMDAPWGKT
ncbi:hypothetical protein PG990_014806 [Apiospora arundinis]